jgi:putative phosphoribosyl transferase
MNQESPLLFRDRAHAAELLAERLAAYRGQRSLILAIPRGAVPMGRIVVDRLGGDLDLALVRKPRSPLDAELAIGAIDEFEHVNRLPGTSESAEFACDAAYLDREIARQRARIAEQRKRYTGDRQSLDARGRIAIVLDDGLATGASMRAALRAVRTQEPRYLICAVPVAALDSLAAVAADADEIVCLEAPAYFGSVGRYGH